MAVLAHAYRLRLAHFVNRFAVAADMVDAGRCKKLVQFRRECGTSTIQSREPGTILRRMESHIPGIRFGVVVAPAIGIEVLLCVTPLPGRIATDEEAYVGIEQIGVIQRAIVEVRRVFRVLRFIGIACLVLVSPAQLARLPMAKSAI